MGHVTSDGDGGSGCLQPLYTLLYFVTAVTPTNPLLDLQRMLSASRQNYDACIGHVRHEHICSDLTASTRLHHLKYDPHGPPNGDRESAAMAMGTVQVAVMEARRSVSLVETRTGTSIWAERMTVSVYPGVPGSEVRRVASASSRLSRALFCRT